MKTPSTILALAAASLIAACDCNCDKPAAVQQPPAAENKAPRPLFTCASGSTANLRAAVGDKTEESDASVSEAIAKDFDAAAALREEWKEKSFEEFLQSTTRECGPEGKFLVNGDVAISDVKQLREFFEERIQSPSPAEPTEPAKMTVDGEVRFVAHLILAKFGGTEAAWNTQQKRQLTYCVSNAFESLHDQVVQDMAAATGAWEAVSDVDFTHVAAQDAQCNAQNGAVMFDVNPVDVGGEYLARAFFPNEPRSVRNVYIDLTALFLDPNDELKLVGILRHELGHALGFRHEHTRPEAGKCFEDNDFVPLTAYDKLSVMHYPQCNGGTSWALALTNRDKSGAACLYGAATGFAIDTTICSPRVVPPTPAPATPTVQTFNDQRVARGAVREYAAFAAKPGSILRVHMKPRNPGPGDPDLYVRFGSKPVVRPPAFACRPYRIGALETCELTVGASPTNNVVRILVHGYTAGHYDLEVSFMKP